MPTCPKCDSKLQYDFVRYHHIGRAHCKKCDFSSPKKINYEVTKIDFKKDKLHLKNNEKEEIYDLITNNIINIYSKNNITLLIWSYFSGTTFSTFNLEILSSILVLLLLEFIYFFLFYISEKIKKVEIL